MKNIFATLLLIITSITAHAQLTDVSPKQPLKLHHAEPLYTDLIRDLGARKGERELNVGFGVSDEKDYISYSGFAEYEFAVANRLGLEIEVPFEMYAHNPNKQDYSLPGNRIEGIKLATQYTFMVSKKYQTSMAVGYIQEMIFSPLPALNHNAPLFEGSRYNPIFIAATRITPNIHALLYTGPGIEQTFKSKEWDTVMDVNANLHYVFNNGNFVGLETNMEFAGNTKPQFVLRPQFKVAFSKDVSIGVLAGIPASGHGHGLSAMTRMIWVP